MTLDEARRLSRERFAAATSSPFRLGYTVGEAGADLPNPYPTGSLGARIYANAVELGARDAQRRRRQGEA